MDFILSDIEDDLFFVCVAEKCAKLTTITRPVDYDVLTVKMEMMYDKKNI